ncbi:MAG TPA: gephyrin-like molybdotransferase Glp [Sedimentisphaerales bacterium]|nr:gephyrin-like molybdotransferase Glp [Sedimentisphaerales bacterium]
MLKYEDAFEIVMSSISGRPLGTERVEIDHALNRVLAEDVSSDMDIPPFNKSAMDGFACRRADLADELTIIETIPAGSLPKKKIGPNHCAKIMTGAVVPEGADCVIMVEYTEPTSDNKIRFTGSQTSDNICLQGEDVKKGDIVLRAGCKISAQHIAVLASLGCTKPLVAVQPRVGIIATGDELVEPGQKPSSCQIRNSNAFQLAAQVTGAAAIATNYGIAADTEEVIDGMLKKAMAENDVVILSGGVSVGDYDLVPGILKKNNVRLLFEKIAVKPGRPTVFGILDEGGRNPVFCFGLPGNPVSTFIIFELFMKPFLCKMMGHNFKAAISHRQLEKTMTRKRTERDSWLPIVFTKNNKVTSIEYHGSAHINALSEADGLLCIPAGVAEIKEGTTVAVRQI